MSKPINDDPFQPWNGIERDNPFGDARDLTDSERRDYHLPKRYNSFDED